ncbi:MAG: glycosyl hydrolase-related protein, partial [Defluviitaleaceae bacterium]|nr:glycosyl hydrolase-related protein [Defluviitaleaceae bacterium]
RAGCGKLALTLIRSSFGPDPYPEIGLNCFEFAVGAEDASENIGLLKRSAGYNNPLLSISGTAHDGDKPAAGSLLSLEGNVILSGVKLAEGGAKDKVVARVYEPDGKGADVRLSFGRQVKAARLVDALERPVDGDVKVSGDMVEFAVKAYKTAAVIVEM